LPKPGKKSDSQKFHTIFFENLFAHTVSLAEHEQNQSN